MKNESGHDVCEKKGGRITPALKKLFLLCRLDRSSYFCFDPVEIVFVAASFFNLVVLLSHCMNSLKIKFSNQIYMKLKKYHKKPLSQYQFHKI